MEGKKIDCVQFNTTVAKFLFLEGRYSTFNFEIFIKFLHFPRS